MLESILEVARSTYESHQQLFDCSKIYGTVVNSLHPSHWEGNSITLSLGPS